MISLIFFFNFRNSLNNLFQCFLVKNETECVHVKCLNILFITISKKSKAKVSSNHIIDHNVLIWGNPLKITWNFNQFLVNNDPMTMCPVPNCVHSKFHKILPNRDTFKGNGSSAYIITHYLLIFENSFKLSGYMIFPMDCYLRWQRLCP